MSSYLKWAGGKGGIASELSKRFPRDIKRYLEPFVGSGAMFFDYYGKLVSDVIFGASKPEVYLNDLNPYLMLSHEAVKSDFERLNVRLKELERFYKEDPEKYYKMVRGSFPNADWSDYMVAADFILLNKSSFNGLWRVNKSGKFNVPWAKREEVNLRKGVISCSDYLKDANLTNLQFDEFIEGSEIREGDFFFIDPPYIPFSETSSFTDYTQDGWGNKDDSRLAQCLNLIDEKGGKFMLTNNDVPLARKLFGKGRKIDTIGVHRFVRAQGKEEPREKVDEIIVTNYD